MQVKGHSGHEWKDYFLDHRPRINKLINRIAYPAGTSTPEVFPFQIQPSRSMQRLHVHSTAPPARRNARRRRQPTEKAKATIAIKPKASSGRSTINSLTAFPAPPSASLRLAVPETPSREPSPPTEVVTTSLRGNSFTPADTQFMINYISWEMSHDSSLTKSKLCDMLEVKVRNLVIHGELRTRLISE